MDEVSVECIMRTGPGFLASRHVELGAQSGRVQYGAEACFGVISPNTNPAVLSGILHGLHSVSQNILSA